ncbi:MAG: ATP-dependent DNA helicase [Lachnospiraceae bacterium]|nr:ATP-dependent DNA helicase [Lachnospiraceae bacterium]
MEIKELDNQKNEITEKPRIRISVRGLVEFILRSGDLDNRHTVDAETAMAEGSRVHRMIQKRMGSEYDAEVPLQFIWETERYALSVEGRADGIFYNPKDEQEITIDEIKGTYRELNRIEQPVAVHLAQAKCYAYFYAVEHSLPSISVRMTYVNLDTEEIRYFIEKYDFATIHNWFEDLIKQYQKWSDFVFLWRENRQNSIHAMPFPFDYRKGQKDLVSYVYQTIYHKKKLFIEAPTGVGKTIATIFPALKAMGEDMGNRLFYLTAKTITRSVAENTLQLLREGGLQCKSVVLTAKDKICFQEETICNPDSCPYAKGHFDRINEAMFDLLTHIDSFNRDSIEEYAEKYKVCPFEFCLDMSLFSDVIICDYNYVFDPHAYLRRFFGVNAGAAKGSAGDSDYLFLIDEAHNLVERGRETYSATLYKEDFLTLKKEIKGKRKTEAIVHHLDKCNKEMLALKRECEEVTVMESAGAFTMAVSRLYSAMEKYLEEVSDSGNARSNKLSIEDMNRDNDQEADRGNDKSVRELILDFYFEISHFLDISERVDDNYVIYSEMESGGRFKLKLFCVNPSGNLLENMQKARSTILFSATLLPIQYYKKLLGGDSEDYEVYAESVFKPEQQALLIARDVTSKYTRRSETEYYRIARYIHEITDKKQGNYMIFFPSYQFMNRVYEVYQHYFEDTEREDCILQNDHMREAEREEFLNHFTGNKDLDLQGMIGMEITMEEERSLLGFCVLGGIFSEGIDLKNDSLIGVLIVGTGLPLVCHEREILKAYFDQEGNGFAYAYRYPGMNKVLQAAGRVIRTVEDLGIVALLDERFLNGEYRRLFPREWKQLQIVDQDSIGNRVEAFWNKNA